MPITLREVKTPQSEYAVNKIKSMVKNSGLRLSFEVPKEFIEKRKYMQSDEFLKDEHNIKMFDYWEKLAKLREKISQEIAELKNKQ